MLKRCLEPGCPTLTPTTRCPTHTRAKDAARGTREQRGYGWAHRKAKVQAEQHTTPEDPCPKCGLPLGPPPWDHGHTDDRTGWQGPTHIRCNRNTAGNQ